MSFARCTRRFALALLILATFVATPLLAEPTYIVELTGEPAAVTAARAAAAGSPLSSPAVEQLRDDLRAQQEILLSRLRRDGVGFVVDTAHVPGLGSGSGTTPVEYRYTLVYNGIALQLSPMSVMGFADKNIRKTRKVPNSRSFRISRGQNFCKRNHVCCIQVCTHSELFSQGKNAENKEKV